MTYPEKIKLVKKAITDLHIPGVSVQTRYNTYYPMGAPMAQLVGFTDANNQGRRRYRTRNGKRHLAPRSHPCYRLLYAA